MNKTLFLFLALFSCILDGAKPQKAVNPEKKTVCLNMIVKDEADVIERCLGSVKRLIDYWVIFDTGSTDGTQKVIKEFMKDIPGELHESKWVNFEHNRNEALDIARKKSDYIFWIDADEILEYSPNFKLPHLDKDFYHMIVRQLDAADAKRAALIKSSLPWKWVGILHEVLHCDQAKTHALLDGVINICNAVLGGRSKIPMTEKYYKDALVLEDALKQEPQNSRYMYYLGVSYTAAEKWREGLEAFQKRVAMPSEDTEETYRSLHTIGAILEKLDLFDDAIDAYFKAYEFRPIRAEPLFCAAKLYRKKGNVLLGYLLVKHALTIPYPKYEACIEYMPYEYGMEIELANCSLLLGKFDEGFEVCKKLLANPYLPEDMKTPVQSNYELARGHVHNNVPIISTK